MLIHEELVYSSVTVILETTELAVSTGHSVLIPASKENDVETNSLILLLNSRLTTLLDSAWYVFIVGSNAG